MEIFQVQITGGEALTHPELGYIIAQLIDRGIIISVSTSGMLLNDKISEDLKGLKNVAGSSIKVSLDGNEKTHNFIRQDIRSYKNAVEFVKKMKKEEIPCQIGTTVVDQSKEELEKLVSLVKELGVQSINIGMICSQGCAKENEIKTSLSPLDLNKFLHNLKEILSKQGKL